MGELVSGLSYDAFVAAARSLRTEEAFRASPFFEEHGAALDRLLLEPRKGGAPDAPAAAPDEPLRVVHWNIEKGKTLPRLASWFRAEPRLAAADVITLNEVDRGMARSGDNADVIAELAAAHGSAYVSLANYVECTTGLAGEAPPGAANTIGCHGTAILTRLPVKDVFVHPLPACWDYFDYREKRFGGRRGLYLLLDRGGAPLIAGTSHLEMRCAPACRARQMRALLDGLDIATLRWGKAPAVLTGDWNTHTFRRGNFRASVLEFLRIVSTDPAALDRELAWPVNREPLFADLRAAGFRFDDANEPVPTAGQPLGRVEDLRYLPAWLAEAVLSASRLRGRTLAMRLDWIAVRGFAADDAATLPYGPEGEEALSDHRPVGCALRVETERPGLIPR